MVLPEGRLEALKRVLQAAAIAPGNRERFLAAGLMTAPGTLVAHWPEAFTRLQPLDKEAVRSHPGAFLASAEEVAYRGKTSGTQGMAFTYFAGQRWNQLRQSARARSLATWGLDPTLPMVNLASRLGPVRPQDSALVGPVDPDLLGQLWAVVAQGPVIVRGYPSRLCEVAVALKHNQIPLKAGHVAAVIATGECLYEMQKALLTQVFQAPVINEYGCQESGISGLSCPEEGRMHLDCDRCLYEVIEGRLVTTDLHNTTLPLVRYCSGDVLAIDDRPCPCGRSGPTARILGRQEESLIDSRWPGEIPLPAFPGILSYQIRLQPGQRQLWVVPDGFRAHYDLGKVSAWFETAFGAGATEVLVESPLSRLGAQAGGQSLCSLDWVHQVSSQPWSEWLLQPLPWGEAQAVAALLKSLASPRHIVTRGLAPGVQRAVDALAQSPPAQQAPVEALKIRTLLWAVSLMAESHATAEQAVVLFDRLWARLERHLAGQAASAALGLDVLAPLLTLETAAVRSRWATVQTLLQRYWPQGPKADGFTLHHYLSVLDIAGYNAQQRPHPWLPHLRPLAALLIGDLQQVAKGLSVMRVAAWAEIVHAAPGQFCRRFTDTNASGEIDLSESCGISAFELAWLALRQALLGQDTAAIEPAFAQLKAAAISPQQLARYWLEQGYRDLALGRPLDPVAWQGILREQVAQLWVSSPRPPAPVSVPIAWVPILRAIAPGLCQMEEPQLAYACLVAAAPPNRAQSHLDRHSRGVNTKQAVVSMASAEPSKGNEYFSPRR